MKFILILVAVFTVILGGQQRCAAMTPTPIPTASCLHHGDINFDDVLSFGDAQLAFLCALGVYVPSAEEHCAGDCNDDGVITAADA